MDRLVSRGGATELAYVTWAFAQGFDCLFRMGLQPDELKTRVTALIEDFDRLPADGFWDLPVSDCPVLARHQVPPLFDLAAVGDRGATNYLRLAGQYERLQVPSLHTGGGSTTSRRRRSIASSLCARQVTRRGSSSGPGRTSTSSTRSGSARSGSSRDVKRQPIRMATGLARC